MAAPRRYVVRHGDKAVPVEVLADGRVRVGVQGPLYEVAEVDHGWYSVRDGAHSWRVAVTGPAEARFVGSGGAAACVDIRPEGQSRPSARKSSTGSTSAPMPGTVLTISVEAGQRVQAGDILLTLEAMKMELPIRAPRDGAVRAVTCRTGELVLPGRVLVEID